MFGIQKLVMIKCGPSVGSRINVVAQMAIDIISNHSNAGHVCFQILSILYRNDPIIGLVENSLVDEWSCFQMVQPKMAYHLKTKTGLGDLSNPTALT